jgi:stress-induced morphogen
MPNADDLRRRIEEALPGASAVIEDYTGTGDHFQGTIAAPQFRGLKLIDQHRLVNDAVRDGFSDGSIHAFTFRTQPS